MGETLARRSNQLSGDQLEDLAGRVETNARRLEGMISTLLDFSRPQARERHLERAEVDVTAIAIEAVQRTGARLQPRRVLLEVEPGVRALGDELMLGQVLDNLLGNVASHTPPETTARVEVRAVGSEVEVAVSDDGPGIAPGELDHVTERFYRGGDHLTRDGGGLGLGLALVRELLALNGSELVVAAAEHGGTRISFRLQGLRRTTSPDLDELSTP